MHMHVSINQNYKELLHGLTRFSNLTIFKVLHTSQPNEFFLIDAQGTKNPFAARCFLEPFRLYHLARDCYCMSMYQEYKSYRICKDCSYTRGHPKTTWTRLRLFCCYNIISFAKETNLFFLFLIRVTMFLMRLM